MIDAATGGATYTANAATYVQLHTGDPGAAGTSNVAGETTRQAVTFAAAGSGAAASTTDATWLLVSTTETYSHVSVWSASSGGTFIGSDQLASSQAVQAGDTYELVAGNLTLSIT